MSAPLYRSNLTIAEALARSGVKGGPIPGIAAQVQPVMILADMSQVYSGPPVEAKAFGGVRSAVAGATRGLFFAFQANAPGGVVIQALQCLWSLGGAGAPDMFIDIRPSPPTLDPPPGVDNLNLVDTGGQPTRSTGFVSPTLDAPTGVGPFVFDPLVFAQLPSVLWIPSGAFLVVQTAGNTGGRLDVFLGWREVPAPIGLP